MAPNRYARSDRTTTSTGRPQSAPANGPARQRQAQPEVLALQNAAGNQATASLLGGTAPPAVAPASRAERREFVRLTIDFLSRSSDYYQDEQTRVDPATFERLINSWYLMVVDRERMIDLHLNGEALLTRELRSAYIAAIRPLMARAASVFGKDEGDLYRENNGRIPMWAWPTPHHLETGITTPIAAGRAADLISGAVSFTTNGFQVTVAPDQVVPKLGDRAETTFSFEWGSVRYRQSQGRHQRIISFSGPGTPSVEIKTSYGRRVNAAFPSEYGRGTTPADVAGGKVTPHSTSLGFHEEQHGLDFVEFLERHPPPQFTGTVGMAVPQFQAAIKQWVNATQAYSTQMNDYSIQRTDCVGITIDQYNQARAKPGTHIKLQCHP